MKQCNITTVKDYSQIQSDFERLYVEVSPDKFNTKVRILDIPEIYRYTGGKTACLKRGFLWTSNRIWIREMPEYQIFYELAHEAGHTVKPYFENISLDAEETKACLFQHIFSQEIKKQNFEWLDDFVAFEAYRKDHIKRTDLKYIEYLKGAEHIAKKTNNDFVEGINYISSILKS